MTCSSKSSCCDKIDAIESVVGDIVDQTAPDEVKEIVHNAIVVVDQLQEQFEDKTKEEEVSALGEKKDGSLKVED